MGNWVILELTPKGEKENPQTIRKAITKVLRGAEVYVPAIETQIGEDHSVHFLLQGYVFVRKDQRSDADFFKLENGKVVQSVLTAPGSTSHRKIVATVTDSYIEKMREQLRAEVNQGIGVGDVVKICSGAYKNIEASVITELPETKEVQVYVQLRSKQTILTLPRSVLKVLDRAPLSRYYAQLGYLKAWTEMAQVVFSYQLPERNLQAVFRHYQQISQWSQAWDRTFSYIRAEYGRLDNLLNFIQDWESRLKYLLSLSERGKKLYSFLFFEQRLSTSRMESLQAKYITLVWLDSVENRLKAISREVEEVGRSLARGRKRQEDGIMVQNIVVDGHNLAFRCFHAPGIQSLVDSQGRPTGVVVSFLKSLGALRKRFPEAKFWVAWDGSPKRRKAQYGDYKGNRPPADASRAPVFDQMRFLQEILPLMSVRQVWNPEEEADDVIGTLVRGELSEQSTIILSTDRDFLQLVSESTMLLIPAGGSRKEILYNRESVLKEFGVTPDKMVELRAFFGDTSDNLPGVPRVPKKILKALLQAHGSVNGVYSSGLAGISRGQYERLRSAEPQVRLNRDLMTLVAVNVQKTDPDVDVDGAASKLRDLEIQPATIIETFFGKSLGSVEA